MRPVLTFLIAAAAFAADYPESPARPVQDTIHGATITDAYRWLEDQDSAETRAWIEAQMAYTRSFLDGTVRGQLKHRLTELQRIDSIGMPIGRAGRYVFTRRLAQENRTSICLRDGAGGTDELIVDPKQITTDESVSVHVIGLSDDGGLLGYGIRKGGEDEREVRVLNLKTRELLPDFLPRANYHSIQFTPDRRGFYYVRADHKVGPRAYYHALGSPSALDREIFDPGYGPTHWLDLELSEDGRYLLYVIALGRSRSDILIQNVQNGEARPRTVVKGIDAQFHAYFAGDHLVLNTNWNAPNWRLLSVPIGNPEQTNWKEIVRESQSPINSVSALGQRLFVNYLDNAITRIKQFDLSGNYLGELSLPGNGAAFGPVGRWSDDEAFFVYTSFLEPATTFRYSISEGQRRVWHQPKIPFQREGTEVRQVWFESRDGTRVPMFLVHRKGLRLNGDNPTLLTGYGGFNISLQPTYSNMIAMWVEMGGVWAVPNLRGGSEFGEKWHRAGMIENKQNTFDDFIAAAEWLIAMKYTKPQRLAIMGGSNGGLLVGAAMTQRPELFGAVLCSMPLLDMLRYHKFRSGPLWISEYGSADDPKQFAFIRKYSPYHRVEKGVKYPAVLFWSGDSDTRVDPLHARKMTALMQASTVSERPVLLYYDAKTGHSGGTPVDKAIEQAADSLAFLMSQVGIEVK